MNAKSASYRYHNKNNSGGNFGFEIRGVLGHDYEINGSYDTMGNLHDLRFGFVYHTHRGCGLVTDSHETLENFCAILTTICRIDADRELDFAGADA